MRDIAGLLRQFYRDHRLLVWVLVIAAVLRLAFLDAVPSYVFDESYYVPAARQLLLNGTDAVPEHPPLVKLVLAGSIAALGDHPFAWRLPSAVAGLFAVFFLYFLALDLSKDKRLAAVAAALLALDPLAVLLSRTAMLDIFMLAFALAGAYFMLRQGRKDLVLAGLLFGLGMASKWPAAFILLAVAAYLWFQKRLEPREIVRILLFAGLAYVLACLPFLLPDLGAWLSTQILNVGKMSSLPAAGPQYSGATEWLYLQKPVWFLWSRIMPSMPPYMHWLAGLAGKNAALAIVAFGNPVFWVPGLLAVVWLALNRAKDVPGVRLFVVLWFVCTYFPFLLMPRANMFIYYMLPVLPAYAVALSQLLITKKLEKPYLAILAVSLALLLPFALGLPVPQAFIDLMGPFISTSITLNVIG